MHSNVTEPQEVAFFLPLNQDDSVVSLKDHNLWTAKLLPKLHFCPQHCDFMVHSSGKPEFTLHKKSNITIMLQGLINMSKILT